MTCQIFKQLSVAAALLTANIVNAEDFTGTFTNPLTGNPGNSGDKGLSEMIDGLLGFIFGIAIIVCPALILWGAFLITTSGGAQEKTKQGKRIITYAVVGLVIIALSGVIKAIIYDIVFQ